MQNLQKKYNLVIEIKGKNNDYLATGRKTFVSKKPINKLLKIISESNNSDEKSGVFRTKLKLINKKMNLSKSITINIKKPKNDDFRSKINDIKSNLLDQEDCVDPQDLKYRLLIDNCQIREYDKRSFTFNSNKCFEETAKKVKRLTEQMIKEETDDDIVFTYEKLINVTHRIIMFKSGNLKNYNKMQSKCFSIKLPNYSSKELVEMLKVKLKNE